MRRSLLLLLAALTLAAESEAQESPPWYRVEVIIFANRDPEAAAAEVWPALPDLAYPTLWQGLEEGNTRESADREFHLRRIEDTVPSLFDLFLDRSVPQLLREYESRRYLRQPQIALQPLVDLDVPRPLVKLPDGERELNAQRRRIANSAGLDVLFHESWLQRIPGAGESLPLIVDTPVRFGGYPELQGSLLFYSSRYLHVETDLWLNTAGGYLDIESEGWRMPAPPPPVDQSEPPFIPFVVNPAPDWLETDSRSAEAPTPIIRDDDGAAAIEHEAQAQGLAAQWNTGDSGAEAAGVEPPDRQTAVSQAAVDAFFAEPPSGWDFRHAVHIAQKRRMRSGELHYIDHPMLGIVVRIDRHEFAPFVVAND